MVEISVIVPTRNRHHLLPRALRSLHDQTFKNFEIILVDDNVPERRVRTEPSLQPYLQDSRLRIIENPHPKNAARARNAGLNVAKGAWITFLDDDDEYLPRKLEAQLQTARDSSLPIGLCSVTYILRGRRRQRRIPKQLRSGDNLFVAFQALPALFHQRTDSVRFNEELYAGEDAYYFLNLLQNHNTNEVFYHDESLVNVYPQAGSHVNTNAEAAWNAALTICRDFGTQYGQTQQQLLMARARLQYYKFMPGSVREILGLCVSLLRLNGPAEVRLILNTVLYKIPWFRRFLVS